MSALAAIYQRRSVRDYAPGKIDQTVIRSLLDAAVHAPTAMHEEPWAFAVIQDKKLLDRLSESAKQKVHSEAQSSTSDQAKHTLHVVDKLDFHVFYNAGTLIVIYSKLEGPFVVADASWRRKTCCWLLSRSAPPEFAVPLYQAFIRQLSADLGKPVETGEFGADMLVSLTNDGPVTIIMDSKMRE